MKRALSMVLVFAMIIPMAACRPSENVMFNETTATQYEYKYQRYSTMSPEEITAELTLEQKAAQMVQPLLKDLKIQGMQVNVPVNAFDPGDAGYVLEFIHIRRLDGVALHAP